MKLWLMCFSCSGCSGAVASFVLMPAEILALVVVNVARWLIYTALLWGIIKLQKLNYHAGGLFASSALAIAVTFIPVVGPYLAWVVLVLCLKKCTGADIAPDIAFTVGIAGALMFAVNLFAIGALMGSLRPEAAPINARYEDHFLTDATDHPAPEIRAPAPAKAAAAPAEPQPTNAPPATPSLAVKGVMLKPSGALAMVAEGGRLHTVGTGDVFLATLPEGRVKLRCESISETGVVLTTPAGARIPLEVK